jgi:hypothetical protein
MLSQRLHHTTHCTLTRGKKASPQLTDTHRALMASADHTIMNQASKQQDYALRRDNMENQAQQSHTINT